MIDLAENEQEGFITLRDIAERQDISRKYLEQIIPFLNRSKLLTSNKGHGGGYKIAKDLSQITVKDILESAEGSLTPVSCMDDEPNTCEKCKQCKTLPIYEGLYQVVIDYLEGITLKDIIDGEKQIKG